MGRPSPIDAAVDRAAARAGAPALGDPLDRCAGDRGRIHAACVARELALSGEEALVIDRDAAGQQAATANAGSLHVQLLSFDFGAKAQAAGRPAAETLRLAGPAVALWEDIAREVAEALELSRTGGLMLAESEEDMRFLAEKTALEARYGVETHLIGGNELRRLEPFLAPSIIGAAFCPAESKINPLTATFAVIAQARAAGAVFAQDAPALAIERDGRGFRVATPAGSIMARRIVNCAGAWSARVSAMVAKPIPVSGAPLQMMATDPGPPVIERVVAHAARHLSLKQTAAGALLIGGGWSASLDEATGASTTIRWGIEGNAWVACRVPPAARGFNLLRVWAGMNIDIDGAPIIGEMPGVPGFYNCVTSNGYTLAPVVARLTMEDMRGSSSLICGHLPSPVFERCGAANREQGFWRSGVARVVPLLSAPAFWIKLVRVLPKKSRPLISREQKPALREESGHLADAADGMGGPLHQPDHHARDRPAEEATGTAFQGSGRRGRVATLQGASPGLRGAFRLNARRGERLRA